MGLPDFNFPCLLCVVLQEVAATNNIKAKPMTKNEYGRDFKEIFRLSDCIYIGYG